MHKYIRGTFLEIPAFLLFLLACWMVVYNVGLFIQNSFGGIVMIITMPIWWCYIINPTLDVMWKLFEDKFWN